MRLLSEEVNDKIAPKDIIEVNKITPKLVKQATLHLKPGKSDPGLTFTSDIFMNAPDILFVHLASVIRCFIIHGHVTDFLLLSTLVPIIKDKLGDQCASKNYRSIAISSLLMKIIDWVIILLYSDIFNLDELQFGFQPKCSTTMCTWLAIETIDYFLRNGSNVYTCLMDMTKAFDLVKHSTLFNKLLDKGLPVIFVRLLIVQYLNQTANVRWNGNLSYTFPLSNGVKQGAVLSPLLYCFYSNDLFKILRMNKIGCWVSGKYVGALGYADDTLLLSPSREGLQKMLKICQDYAETHNLIFSTNEVFEISKKIF